jgi:hypothetical protein
MAKIFYDHIVKFEEITEELGRYELDAVEIEEIVRIADETVHISVLDVILTHLPKAKHEEFLIKFHDKPHDVSLVNYLEKEAHPEIKKKIAEVAEKAKKEILGEIKKSKRK